MPRSRRRSVSRRSPRARERRVGRRRAGRGRRERGRDRSPPRSIVEWAVGTARRRLAEARAAHRARAEARPAGGLPARRDRPLARRRLRPPRARRADRARRRAVHASGSSFGDRVDVELRELFVQGKIGPAWLRAGKQQVVWGQADGLKVLDVVDPQDFREFILPTFEDSRIPLWTLNTEIPIGAGAAPAAVDPRSERAHISAAGRHLRVHRAATRRTAAAARRRGRSARSRSARAALARLRRRRASLDASGTASISPRTRSGTTTTCRSRSARIDSRRRDPDRARDARATNARRCSAAARATRSAISRCAREVAYSTRHFTADRRPERRDGIAQTGELGCGARLRLVRHSRDAALRAALPEPAHRSPERDPARPHRHQRDAARAPPVPQRDADARDDLDPQPEPGRRPGAPEGRATSCATTSRSGSASTSSTARSNGVFGEFGRDDRVVLGFEWGI